MWWIFLLFLLLFELILLFVFTCVLALLFSVHDMYSFSIALLISQQGCIVENRQHTAHTQPSSHSSSPSSVLSLLVWWRACRWWYPACTTTHYPMHGINTFERYRVFQFPVLVLSLFLVPLSSRFTPHITDHKFVSDEKDSRPNFFQWKSKFWKWHSVGDTNVIPHPISNGVAMGKCLVQEHSVQLVWYLCWHYCYCRALGRNCVR